MNLPFPQVELGDKLYWETLLWKSGARFVAGLDEAGRGALAGPVVAAAVIFEPGVVIPGIDDSKKLTSEHREKLFEIIIQKASDYAIGSMPVEMIDDLNILNASLQAMREAINQLKKTPDYLLIDGNRGIGMPIPQKLLVGGDGISHSIGAASILAKVTRDRMMTELEKEFPQFCFSRHKGYGTRGHFEEMQKYGVAECHRKSFEPVRNSR